MELEIIDVVSLTSQDDRLLDEDDEALSIQLSEADDYLLEDDRHLTTSPSVLKISPSPTPPSPPNGKRMIKLTKKSNSIALPLPSNGDAKRKRLVRSNSVNNIGSATTRKVIKLDDDAEDTLVAKKSQPVQGGLKTSNVSATLDYLKKGKGKNETMAPPSHYYRPSPVYGQSHGKKRNKRRPLSYLPPPSSNVSSTSPSAPVKYQNQESQGNRLHDKGGQFDYKPQVRSVRYEETISPQLEVRLSNHPVSCDKGFHKMTVYEDGSKKYWDKVINVTDYSAPTLRAVAPGSTQPGLQSPEPLLNKLQRNEPEKLQVTTSNTPNSVNNKNWKRGGKRRMISRPASSEVHAPTPLKKHVPNQLVSPLLAASPSVMPVSNPSVTVAKSRTLPKSYPPEVLHGFTDFHDTPAPLLSSETTVNKPKLKEPYSVSVAPVSTTTTTTTTTSGSGLTGSLAKPLESFVSKCLLHKQKYSTTCLKYSGSFSVDMMKYMSPKKPVAATSATPDRYYVPPSKTSTPLFGQKSTSSTPLFYRSTSKEEVATVPPSSHFSLDRLSTNSTQFKLNHL
ncbi:PREDICTED: uncharacterized protein LOC100638512 [Amphimedon queenslandica]|uniref:Uncharacterized protein n=1 Tax=Amphimedon queenslandica TaxID=400682 RepID=A0A1X7V038_AMPQE|nr:PREDICTED: uncharacterized protein LOC100638512 [Amphimedon queenslandica]|eukprot:XP_003386115.1 PREDICTED: uncharacterized protein LOC100638512 [Amphimedon queenslandica]